MENKFILFHGRMLNKELIKCAYLQGESDKLFPNVRPVVEFINDSNIIPVGNFTDDYESAMDIIYELYRILGGSNTDITQSRQCLFKSNDSNTDSINHLTCDEIKDKIYDERDGKR